MPDTIPDTLLTTAQAAQRLGLSVRRVQAIIQRGDLPAVRVGRDYVIHAPDLALVAIRPPRGRRWHREPTR